MSLSQSADLSPLLTLHPKVTRVWTDATPRPKIPRWRERTAFPINLISPPDAPHPVGRSAIGSFGTSFQEHLLSCDWPREDHKPKAGRWLVAGSRTLKLRGFLVFLLVLNSSNLQVIRHRSPHKPWVSMHCSYMRWYTEISSCWFRIPGHTPAQIFDCILL